MGMAVVPVDQGRCRDDPGKAFAWDPEWLAVWCACCEDNRVVQVRQLGDADVGADPEVADELYAGTAENPLELPHERLHLEVVRRYPVSEQAEGRGKAVSNVNQHVVSL
jgi:hypothetical protein